MRSGNSRSQAASRWARTGTYAPSSWTPLSRIPTCIGKSIKQMCFSVCLCTRARVGTRRSSPSRAVTVQWQCASTEAQLVWVLSAVAAMDRKTGSALGTAKTARPLPCSRHPAPLVGNPPVWRSAARAPSADSSGNGVRALPPKAATASIPVGNRRRNASNPGPPPNGGRSALQMMAPLGAGRRHHLEPCLRNGVPLCGTRGIREEYGS